MATSILWTIRPYGDQAACLAGGSPGSNSMFHLSAIPQGSRRTEMAAARRSAQLMSCKGQVKQCGWTPQQQYLSLFAKSIRRKSAPPLRCKINAESEILEIENREKLISYICAGPLAGEVGLTLERMDNLIGEWIPLAKKMCDRLELCYQSLDDVGASRVFLYYLPVFQWCKDQLMDYRENNDMALVIGFNAPQGCGKTTIVAELVELFSACDIGATYFSVDDFYLRFDEQNQLAEANPGNSLMQMRGNAGTHDLQLGSDTISKFRNLTESGMKEKAPRYDKSLNQGRGDRAPESQWDTVEGPLSIILVEGWMFGFTPLPEEDIAVLDPDLINVNKALRQYKAAWDSQVDSWIVIQVDDPEWVFQWRLQAEHVMKMSGKPGMSDDQIRDFVSRFMPAYKAYLPTLYQEGPTTAKPGHLLQICIDQNRRIVS